MSCGIETEGSRQQSRHRKRKYAAVAPAKRAAQSKAVRMIVSNVRQKIEEKYPQTRQWRAYWTSAGP
jgi:hypothetical protein